jgi:hypothetical protein
MGLWMKNKGSPKSDDDESAQLYGKMFRLTRDAIVAFDTLKARQGPRSGPRLMAEAVDLLLVAYEMEPVGSPSPVRGETKPSRPHRRPAPK